MNLRHTLLAALLIPSLRLPAPPAPELAAKSWLLLDQQSGKILNAKDPDARIEPASLTKR